MWSGCVVYCLKYHHFDFLQCYHINIVICVFVTLNPRPANFHLSCLLAHPLLVLQLILPQFIINRFFIQLRLYHFFKESVDFFQCCLLQSGMQDQDIVWIINVSAFAKASQYQCVRCDFLFFHSNCYSSCEIEPNRWSRTKRHFQTLRFNSAVWINCTEAGRRK